jgi:hypothetical protein
VRISLAPALTAALERAMKLLQTPLSGLPGGLSDTVGLSHGGLGAISWSAHALTAEARLLAQPVSYELATTTPEEGIGDRITMAPLAARRLTEQTSLARGIIAVELLCAPLKPPTCANPPPSANSPPPPIDSSATVSRSPAAVFPTRQTSRRSTNSSAQRSSRPYCARRAPARKRPERLIRTGRPNLP